jgi:SNF2 family DNA or RNA helicase
MKVEITVHGNRFRVRTPYSVILVDRFNMVPGKQWHPEEKVWSFPAVRDCILMVADVCGLLPEMLPAELKALCQGVYGPPVPEPDLGLVDGHVFKTAPYEHQKKNLARLLANDRWLLADEQGTGKSHSVANMFCRNLLSQPRLNALIVCPKSVMQTWKEQMKEHAGWGCILVEGTMTQRIDAVRHSHPLKVVNYEQLIHNFDLFKDIYWHILILDEIHRCKNFTSKTCKAVRKLSAKAKYVWGLSGTPAPNGLEDWLGVLSAIKPDLLPVDTKTGFEARYCLKQRMGGTGPFTIIGYRNVAELHGYVASITSRVTKDEALDLPPKIFCPRHVSLDGDQARIYRDLKKDAVTRLKTAKAEGTLTVQNVLTESLRLLQVVGGFVPDDAGTMHEIHPKAKLVALEDVLDEVGNKQVVIWCAFVEEVKFLAYWLIKKYGGAGKADTSHMTGETPADVRTKCVDNFKRGLSRFFIATAATGGTGINGLEVADTEVCYSRNFNLATYLQSIDRCHRIGSTRPVSVIKLIADSTVDVKVDEALDHKASLQEMLLMKPEEMF